MQLICGVYSSWRDYGESWADLHDAPSSQLNTLERELRAVEALRAPRGLIARLNCHAGGDGWTEKQARGFFGEAVAMANSAADDSGWVPYYFPFRFHSVSTTHPAGVCWIYDVAPQSLFDVASRTRSRAGQE
jgi:hypothetical protein